MVRRKYNLNRTEEIPAWRISLTKLESIDGETKKGSVIGWEGAPPQKGRSYVIYLHEGTALKTSAVQDIQEADNAVIIKTANSVYQVEYIEFEFVRDVPMEESQHV